MKQKKTKNVRTWIVHRLGGLMREEIPELIIQNGGSPKVEDVGVCSEFTSAEDRDGSAHEELARKIGEKLLEIGAIKYVKSDFPPYRYTIWALVKVIMPTRDWW